MFVPTSMLKQLYTLGSLKETQNGLCFSLKNRIKSAHFNQVIHLSINDQRVDNNKILVALNSEQKISLDTLEQNQGVDFPLGAILHVFADGIFVSESKTCKIQITLSTHPFGDIDLTLLDKLSLPTQALHGSSTTKLCIRDNRSDSHKVI